MKFDFLYIIGLLLALLAEIFPLFVPMHIPELADALFLLYFLSLKRVRGGNAYYTWMVVVVAFFAISVVWSIEVWEWYWGMRQVITVFIGMLASYKYLNNTPDGVKNILKVYLVEAVMMVIFILTHIDQVEMGVRLGSLLGEEYGSINSNIIGMNLCYALYTVFVLVNQGIKRRLIRIAVLIGAGVLLIYLILLTGSRKALIMLAIPLLVFSFFQQRKDKGIIIFMISAGLLFIGYNLVMDIPGLYEVMGKRIEDAIAIITGDTQGGEDMSRYFLIEYGKQWFIQKPLLGYGLNNFRVLSNSTTMFVGSNFYAHNNYIELLVDVGIVGTLIYYSFLFHFWKHLKGHLFDSRLNRWVFALIVTRLFLDTAMVSYYSFTSNFILCLGFHAVYITQKNKANNNSIGFDGRNYSLKQLQTK